MLLWYKMRAEAECFCSYLQLPENKILPFRDNRVKCRFYTFNSTDRTSLVHSLRLSVLSREKKNVVLRLIVVSSFVCRDYFAPNFSDDVRKKSSRIKVDRENGMTSDLQSKDFNNFFYSSSFNSNEISWLNSGGFFRELDEFVIITVDTLFLCAKLTLTVIELSFCIHLSFYCIELSFCILELSF